MTSSSRRRAGGDFASNYFSYIACYPPTDTICQGLARVTSDAWPRLAGMGAVGSSKRAVLEHLKREGPLTAPELAERLGVTTAAVRLSLTELDEQGLVAPSEPVATGSRGRPAARWQLTRSAQDMFPERHGELTLQLLEAIRQTVGEKGLDRVLLAREEHQVEAYRAASKKGSLRQRLRALAAARTSEGYMAEVTDDGGVLRLVEHHCPICSAAESCQGLCRSELSVFREVLGDDVEIEREEHLLAGARRCVYRVSPVSVRGSSSGGRGRTK